MGRDLIQFRWHVFSDGYEFVDAEEVDGQELFLGTLEAPGVQRMLQKVGGWPCMRPPRNYARMAYNPLARDPDLYTTFANLEPTEKSILAFAGCYGMLGGSATRLITHGSVLAQAEPLAVWQAEIAVLGRALSLWGMVQDLADLLLEQHILWDERGVYYTSQPGVGIDDVWRLQKEPRGEWPAVWPVVEPIHGQFQPGDSAGPARRYLQQVIDRYLREGATPRLLQNSSSSEEANLYMHLVPGSLLGAVWLQFAQAVDQGRGHRRCEGCGKWFPLTGRRSDKKTCDDSCRKRKSRAQTA